MTAIIDRQVPAGSRGTDFRLRNGEMVRIRPVQPDDEDRLLEFLKSLSTESRKQRFFTAAADLDWFAHEQSHVDYLDDFGLVATVAGRDEIVGHAMYARVAGDRAEVALEVADAYQGQGLGTRLLELLIEIASRNGVRVIEAEVLPENRPMLAVFRHYGTQLDVRRRPSELHVAFPAAVGTASPGGRPTSE